MEDKELTLEESKALAEDTNEYLDGLKDDIKDVKNVLNFPEDEEKVEELDVKNMDVVVDPLTGEHKILGSTEEVNEVKDSFDEMVRKINEDDDFSFSDDAPITEAEAVDYLSDNASESIINEISKGTNYTNEEIQQLLIVTNKRIKKQEVNVYKELPESMRKLIDQYTNQMITHDKIDGNNHAFIRGAKNSIAEALIDEFISDIQIDRFKNDFARDLENIYATSNKEIAETSLEYFEERNAAYREAAEEIEDEEKKAKLLAILDQIDEARALTGLKEFAKACKVKPIETEKPDNRVYRNFLAKYKDSNNNIYDIKVAIEVLYRHLVDDNYTRKDVELFFIVFCKYVRNYDVNVPTQHAFMYYVLYYAVMLDGDKSDNFKNNVKEVINNIKLRNTFIK